MNELFINIWQLSVAAHFYLFIYFSFYSEDYLQANGIFFKKTSPFMDFWGSGLLFLKFNLKQLSFCDVHRLPISYLIWWVDYFVILSSIKCTDKLSSFYSRSFFIFPNHYLIHIHHFSAKFYFLKTKIHP